MRSSRRAGALLIAAVVAPLLAAPALAAAPTGTVALDDVAITPANTAVLIDVLANDTGPKPPEVGYFLSVFTQPPHGTVLPNEGGLRYTPAAGFIGQDTFRYAVRRLSGGITTLSEADVTVTVAPPTLPALSVSGNIFDRITLPLPPAGVNLTGFGLVVGDAAHGRVSTFGNGEIVYSGDFGFVGQDRVDYAITSDGATVATAGVAVTVNGPVARPDEADTPAGVPVRIPVLDNDSDAGSYRVVPGAAANGTVERVEGDALVYTPAPGFPESGTGTDRFTYRLRSPGNIEVTEAAVTVTVHRLTARPDVALTGPGRPVTVPVLANDDAPGGTAVEIVTPPAAGVARVEGGGIVFTPSAGFEDDSLAYVLVDSAGRRSAPATVDLHLVDAVDDDVTSADGGPVTVDVRANDWLYGDLDVELLGETSGGTVTGGNGRYTFTPQVGGAGIGTFRYALLDGERTLDTAVVVVRYPGPPTTTTTTAPTSSSSTTTTSTDPVTSPTTTTTTDEPSTTTTSTTTTTGSSSTTSTTTSSGPTTTTTTTTTTRPTTSTTTSRPPTTTTTTTTTSTTRTTTTTRPTSRTTTRTTTTAPRVTSATTSRPARTTTTTTARRDGDRPTTTTTRRVRTTRTTGPAIPPVTAPGTTPEITPGTAPTPPAPVVTPPATGAPPATGRSGTPKALRTDRPSLAPGQAIAVSGTGCAPGAPVRITLDGAPAGIATAGADGSFSDDVTVGENLGRYRLQAVCLSPTTGVTSFDTAVDVVQVQSAGGPSGAAATALLGAVAGLLSFYLLTGAVLGLGAGRRRR